MVTFVNDATFVSWARVFRRFPLKASKRSRITLNRLTRVIIVVLILEIRLYIEQRIDYEQRLHFLISHLWEQVEVEPVDKYSYNFRLLRFHGWYLRSFRKSQFERKKMEGKFVGLRTWRNLQDKDTAPWKIVPEAALVHLSKHIYLFRSWPCRSNRQYDVHFITITFFENRVN